MSILLHENPNKNECYRIIKIQEEEFTKLVKVNKELELLVNSCIEFISEQLVFLPAHEHNDPILARMDFDMGAFITMTQDEVIEITR